MLQSFYSVHIYTYLLTVVEKAGVVSEAQGLIWKVMEKKWVEKKKNRCFDNLCQMFFQRPASDLKYYADVGFGLQLFSDRNSASSWTFKLVIFFSFFLFNY